MTTECDAIAAGHICLDIIPDLSASTNFAEHFAPGHLIHVGPASLSTGGAVSNTGLVLSMLGTRTQLMGKIGDDLFGQAILQIVERCGSGLAAGMIRDPGAGSSYTVIINPPGVDRIFLHFTGANDSFGADDIDYSRIGAARLFHFGYPPLMREMYEQDGGQLTKMFRRAKATGATTSLDMAFPDPSSPAGKADWARILEATLPYVDVFLPSLEEMLFMLRPGEYRRRAAAAGGSSLLDEATPELLSDIGRQLIGMGTGIAGLKLGDRGFYLRTAACSRIGDMGRAGPGNAKAWAMREFWSPCFQVKVLGTTGAGDATIAGFLSALLRARTAEEAITAAVAVGACNVEAPDALSGIRGWDETMGRVAAGWQRHPLQIPAPGWSFDSAAGLWRGPC